MHLLCFASSVVRCCVSCMHAAPASVSEASEVFLWNYRLRLTSKLVDQLMSTGCLRPLCPCLDLQHRPVVVAIACNAVSFGV